MHLATTEAIRRATQGQYATQAVSYSLWFYNDTTQNPPNSLQRKTCDSRNLLCYLSSFQTCVIVSRVLLIPRTCRLGFNLSLSRALHVYRDHIVLLVDTGIPPLALIQYTHQTQMHFWIESESQKHGLTPFLQLYSRPHQVPNPTQPLPHHPQLPHLELNFPAQPRSSRGSFRGSFPHIATLPHESRERADQNKMHTTISTLWRMDLPKRWCCKNSSNIPHYLRPCVGHRG